MSDTGIWVFNNGEDSNQTDEVSTQTQGPRKVLVHLPTGEIISSYASLEGILTSLGWERYYETSSLFQFRKRSSIELISLPKDFSKFKSVHMYDIVDKNPNTFQVRDS